MFTVFGWLGWKKTLVIRMFRPRRTASVIQKRQVLSCSSMLGGRGLLGEPGPGAPAGLLLLPDAGGLAMHPHSGAVLRRARSGLFGIAVNLWANLVSRRSRCGFSRLGAAGPGWR